MNFTPKRRKTNVASVGDTFGTTTSASATPLALPPGAPDAAISTNKPSFQPAKCKSNTHSSARTKAGAVGYEQAATNASDKRKARLRHRKKLHKILALPQAVPGRHIVSSSYVKSADLFYSYGAGPAAQRTNTSTNGTFTFTDHDFTIVDNCSGARYYDADDKLYFVLIPRKHSCDSIGKQGGKDLKMLDSFQNSKHNSGKRGKEHKCRTPGKLCFPGNKTRRNGHGLWIFGLDDKDQSKEAIQRRQRLIRYTNRCEDLLATWLPAADLLGIEAVRDVVDGVPSLGTHPKAICAAAAMAYDYNSAAHIDKDFFFSILGVRTFPEELNTQVDPAPPPVQYFVFPTIGVAVALRPGDHLIFNPTVPHCAAEKLSGYGSNKTYLCTLYLKTDLVGRNDNRIELTNLQKHLVDSS